MSTILDKNYSDLFLFQVLVQIKPQIIYKVYLLVLNGETYIENVTVMLKIGRYIILRYNGTRQTPA